MKLAYWPGCVSRGFTTELHGSMALVAEGLGVELVTLDRANCCGAGVIAEHNQELADTLNARTFALAQETGLAMMNICSTCQGAQSECQERLDANAEYRKHINEALSGEGLEYVAGKDGFTNKNFLWLLVEDIGLDTLREQRQAAAQGLRVDLFNGCDVVLQGRPWLRRRPDRRNYLEQVIEALAGMVVDDDGSTQVPRFSSIITMNGRRRLRRRVSTADVIDQGADGSLRHVRLPPQPAPRGAGGGEGGEPRPGARRRRPAAARRAWRWATSRRSLACGARASPRPTDRRRAPPPATRPSASASAAPTLPRLHDGPFRSSPSWWPRSSNLLGWAHHEAGPAFTPSRPRSTRGPLAK